MSSALADTAVSAGAGAETVAYAVDIGGSFIRLGRVFGPGQVEVVGRRPTPAASWPEFCAALTELLAEASAEGDALPLAISTAGLFDKGTGTILAANIPAFHGHNVPAELSELLARQVLIANDADSFALAEAVVGAGRGHEVVLAIILGTGVGGGLVVGGRLVQGVGGITGEWGHASVTATEVLLPGETIPVRPPQLLCGCGEVGCTDTIGGARGLERLHLHLNGAALDSYAVLDAWEAGDTAAARSVALWAELLAVPLAFALNITGASIVPVGGGLANRPALVAALDAAVRPRTLRRPSAPLLVPGSYLTDGGLVGVSVLASTAQR